jgi:hypothetical protein
LAWEVPVTTGPDHGIAAGRSHLRAAHADREQVVTVLKSAYVQGRLTKDELDTRAGQAFAARTYADLAALTADLPVGGPVIPGPARVSAGTLGSAARRSGIFLLITIGLVVGALVTGTQALILFAFLAFMAASGFMGYGIVDSRQERRRSATAASRPGPSEPFRLQPAAKPAHTTTPRDRGRRRVT